MSLAQWTVPATADLDLGSTPEDVGLLPGVEIESDEPEMESDLHQDQMFLLLESLRWAFRERSDYYAGGNLTIFYKLEQLERRAFRGPDFFVVLGVDPGPRKSWTVWREGGKYPNVIIEILSPSTQAIDRGLKKQIYRDIFRTPEYFLFDLDAHALDGYRLQDGAYAPIAPDEAGRLRSNQLDLLLGTEAGALRFFAPDGALVLTRAEAEAQRAARAEAERERLAAKLRELGVDPDALR